VPHLYQALTWTIDEPERPREYVIHDNGQLLANVSRVAVRRPDDAAMPYANPHTHYDETRIVLCVAGPDRTPYFYLDRTNDPMRPQPSFVVAPNGGLIGSVVVETDGIKGAFQLLSGRRGSGYALRDARNEPVASILFPPRSSPGEEGTITDRNDTELARHTIDHSPYNAGRRRRIVRLHHPLAEPLRTLVLASMIGVELMIPVT
jgi:hypothetical protein